MGDTIQILDIILLAMIAGFIALRLRSVLGNKTGHEENPEETGKRKLKEGAHLRLVEEGDLEKSEASFVPGPDPVSLEGLTKVSKNHLNTILTLEPEFSIEQFMDGATKAHPMILEAFWLGHMNDVGGFLSEDVYNQFSGAVTAREQEGLVLENRLIETDEKTVDSILVDNRIAKITVRFVSSIVSITRNEDGEVVDGDVSDAIDVVDVWTFQRELGSRDPNWLLVATSAG